MGEVVLIPEDLGVFLETGVSVLVGTRDAQLRPAALRAVAAFVAPDRRSVAVHLPLATAARTLANLRENGRLAATFSRIADHRTMQVKGRCVEIRDSSEDDRIRQERYLAAFASNLEAIGMQSGRMAHLTQWPSVTVHVAVEEIFEQTPGPNAGCKMAGRAR